MANHEDQCGDDASDHPPQLMSLLVLLLISLLMSLLMHVPWGDEMTADWRVSDLRSQNITGCCSRAQQYATPGHPQKCSTRLSCSICPLDQAPGCKSIAHCHPDQPRHQEQNNTGFNHKNVTIVVLHVYTWMNDKRHACETQRDRWEQ